jgi:hypothetical protein
MTLDDELFYFICTTTVRQLIELLIICSTDDIFCCSELEGRDRNTEEKEGVSNKDMKEIIHH